MSAFISASIFVTLFFKISLSGTSTNSIEIFSPSKYALCIVTSAFSPVESALRVAEYCERSFFNIGFFW